MRPPDYALIEQERRRKLQPLPPLLKIGPVTIPAEPFRRAVLNIATARLPAPPPLPRPLFSRRRGMPHLLKPEDVLADLQRVQARLDDLSKQLSQAKTEFEKSLRDFFQKTIGAGWIYDVVVHSTRPGNKMVEFADEWLQQNKDSQLRSVI
ncbi:hypothetical protein [Pyrobaculum sp.]|uniref:hypothetical protein n=1 Tax=Pyrobaculum sp. TaxID=2004705 RepID=UPI003D14A051